MYYNIFKVEKQVGECIFVEYIKMSEEELKKELELTKKKLEEISKQKLALDLSRGKPSKEQLELSMEMLSEIDANSVLDSDCGTDCRNYGMPDGIPEARRMMAHIMGTHSSNTMVMGNSSLTLMYGVISHAMVHGIMGEKPWYEVKNRKFLCPVPGYDRHFAITEHFGFELINVPMRDDGPDMDIVEELVKDEDVKGIWCVPKYQNPTGVTFSDDVIKRFASLNPAARDFRIFWDNAYCVHGFDSSDEIVDIISECEKNSNNDMVYEFCSTSKVTFPGSGIAAVASSPANLNDLRSFLKFATIGPDKINQLRHVRYFKNTAGIKAHMKKHAKLLQPKFELTNRILTEELGEFGVAEWTNPSGGYFMSFNSLFGCANEIVRRCAESGVKFTPSGATYPYGSDPENKNIRLAPSFASIEDIETAVKVLSYHTKIVSLEKILK